MEISQYAEQSLDIIAQSNFLQPEDLAALVEMKEELQDTFEKKQIWRTETEMRVSVLNDVRHPTKASKYWQSVKEQSVFFENLVTLSFDYRREIVNIKKLSRKLEQEGDVLERELLEIDIEEAQFRKKNMEVASKDRMRELKLWSKIKKELDDGTFNTENVDDHQLISFARSFILQSLISGNSGSPAEKQNLQGVLETTLRTCNEKGLMDKVMIGMSEDAVRMLKG